MTPFHRHLRRVLGGLAACAMLLAQPALATSLDTGPRAPTPALTCPPTVGGEVDTLCAPQPHCGCEPCRTCDPCKDNPWRCRVED